jgi:uncharacterized membrane protein YeaQ/YmgE (transglycosylase-associated protein family)
MGAAAGAIAYLVASDFKQGSWAAVIITAIAGATVLGVCNTVCFFVDTRPGMDYWGSHENPALFLTKGYIASIIGGLVGSWLLNTKRGVSVVSGEDSQTDPMACSFDPESKLGRRVLAVCEDWGGEATHGCWIRGTFVINRQSDRLLTRVFEVRKTRE